MIRNYFNRLSYSEFLVFFTKWDPQFTYKTCHRHRSCGANKRCSLFSVPRESVFFSRWCWNHMVKPPLICKQTKLVDTRWLSRSSAVNTAWCLRSRAGTTVDALRQIHRLDASEVGETLSLSGTVTVCPIRHFSHIHCDENRVSTSHKSFSHGYIFCR